MLNNSVWKIEKVEVYGNGAISRPEGCSIDMDSFSHKTETIKLGTYEDSLVWFDGDGESHLDPDNPNDNLTVNIKDPDDGTQSTITLIKVADGFKASRGWSNMQFEASIPRNDNIGTIDTETITCQGFIGDYEFGVADLLKIKYTCKGSNDMEYFSWLYLTRIEIENWKTNGRNLYTETFATLFGTDWTIKSVDVVGPNGKSMKIKENTYNYDVSKIKLLTYQSNRKGDLSGGLKWLDGKDNSTDDNKPLTVNFSGGIFTTYTAPILSPTNALKYKGKDANNGTLEYQTTLSNGNTETIFQHNWEISNLNERKTNPFVRVSHSFTINNKKYTSNMLLVPAK